MKMAEVHWKTFLLPLSNHARSDNSSHGHDSFLHQSSFISKANPHGEEIIRF